MIYMLVKAFLLYIMFEQNESLRDRRVMIMNGSIMNYERYLESLEKTPEVNVPRVKLDLQALIQFAKQRGVKPSQLSGEEQRSFIR